jgi:hypothetical protein
VGIRSQVQRLSRPHRGERRTRRRRRGQRPDQAGGAPVNGELPAVEANGSEPLAEAPQNEMPLATNGSTHEPAPVESSTDAE